MEEEIVESMKRTFRLFDDAESGTIPRGDLAFLLKDLNKDWSDDMVEMFLNEADQNRDGVINYKEFCDFVVFMGGDAPLKKAVQKKWPGPNTEGGLIANMSLRTAATTINPQGAEKALKEGAGVNSDSDGRGTALIWAAAAQSSQRMDANYIVELLLGSNADPDAITKNGYTALHRAADNDNGQIIHTLCRAKADINVAGHSLKAPLHQAASMGRMDAIRVLLNNSANVDARDFQGYTPLHVAVQEDQAEAVGELLLRGTPCLVKDSGNHEDTALHVAVRLKRHDVINILLNFESGSHANEMLQCKNWRGRTPLDLADDNEVIGVLKGWGGNA